MFKNRALQVKMVKTADTNDTTDRIDSLRATMDPNEINNLLKDQVKTIGLTIIGVAAAVTAMSTAREVIVNNTNPAYR